MTHLASIFGGTSIYRGTVWRFVDMFFNRLQRPSCPDVLSLYDRSTIQVSVNALFHLSRELRHGT
jgi:hypothetical protein